MVPCWKLQGITFGSTATQKGNSVIWFWETIIAVLTYDQVIVRTSTRSTLNIAANPTQILNFKANFYKELELFSKKIMLRMVDT